jgi:hypothetical protein
VDLRPGRYAFVSYDVDATGRPRGDKHKWVMVTAMRSTALIPDRLPVADATLKVRDNRIDMIGVLRRGQRIVQIENTGTQAHGITIVRLKSGMTVDDAQRWFRDRKGTSPFVYVGGTTPMSAGVSAQTRLLFQSGTHVVLTDGAAVVVTFKVA